MLWIPPYQCLSGFRSQLLHLTAGPFTKHQNWCRVLFWFLFDKNEVIDKVIYFLSLPVKVFFLLFFHNQWLWKNIRKNTFLLCSLWDFARDQKIVECIGGCSYSKKQNFQFVVFPVRPLEIIGYFVKVLETKIHLETTFVTSILCHQFSHERFFTIPQVFQVL